MDLEHRNDGIYLSIRGREKDKELLRQSIMEFIKKYEIDDIDNIEIEKLLESHNTLRSLKLSEDTSLFSEDEKMALEVAEDKLEGYIYFIKEKFGGNPIKIGDIKEFLEDNKIIYGIDETEINTLTIRRNYGENYLIAKGKEPVNGKDAYIEYLFEDKEKKLKPVILEDGTVDYKNLKNISMAEEGQVLAKIIESTDGTDGKDIYGNPIEHKKGSNIKFLYGQNININEENNELISNINGQIINEDGRISVSPVIEIHDNIGPKTGNIDFNGSIIVHGDVMEDYEVIAGGNIEIFGMVSGDKIIAKNNILISGGVQGRNTIIKAGGNISAKFLMNGDIEAKGDIYTGSIIRCNIKSQGNVEIEGRHATLNGGVNYIRDTLTTGVLGNITHTKTEVKVGLDPDVYLEYRKQMILLREIEEEYENFTKDKITMEKMGIENLDPNRKIAYNGLVHSMKFTESRILGLRYNIKKILDRLDSYRNNGEIIIKESIYPGVELQVGNALVHIREEIGPCRIINRHGNIDIEWD